MLAVEILQAIWHCAPIVSQLLEHTREEVARPLVALPPEVAVNICDTSRLVVLKASSELSNDNGCEDRLSGTRDARTEQCLILSLHPCRKLWRVQKPLSGLG